MSKLSIITINYNNHDGLQKTMESVFSQTFTDYEYIIIDGGSDDGSKAIIQEHSGKLSYWVSEKDKGVYEAMNKGIEQSSGEYLLMLNSGDTLINNTTLAEVFSNTMNEDVIYGNNLWIEEGNSFETIFPSKPTFGYFRHASLGHQSAFIKRTLHDLIGLYDINLSIVADWKFFILAICKYNCTYRHLPMSVSLSDRKGLSCHPVNWNKILQEREQVLIEEFGAFLDDYKYADKLERLTRHYANSRVIKLLRFFRILKLSKLYISIS